MILKTVEGKKWRKGRATDGALLVMAGPACIMNSLAAFNLKYNSVVWDIVRMPLELSILPMDKQDDNVPCHGRHCQCLKIIKALSSEFKIIEFPITHHIPNLSSTGNFHHTS